MKDIQSQEDDRKINIRKVGVKSISYPIVLQDKAQVNQHTVASVNMFVNLPHQFKGTHMSRFVEILNDYHGHITIKNFHSVLEKMKARLDAKEAHIEIAFPFFIDRSDEYQKHLAKYDCAMHGSLAGSEDLQLDIAIPLSVNQRQSLNQLDQGTVNISVSFNRFIWIEDLIEVVETALESCKHGEKHQQMSVEQVNERVSVALKQERALKTFKVTTEIYRTGYSVFATTELFNLQA